MSSPKSFIEQKPNFCHKDTKTLSKNYSLFLCALVSWWLKILYFPIHEQKLEHK